MDPHVSTAPSSHLTVDYQEELSEFDWKKSPMNIIRRLDSHVTNGPIFPVIDRNNMNQE